MPHPTIHHVVEIKRQIDLVFVIMSDGTYRFRSKGDLTQVQIDNYYLSIAGDIRNPYEQDHEGIVNALRRKGL